MKAQVMHVNSFPGRVLVGPKKLGRDFVRIVSQRNGSGLIECYDQSLRAWQPAPLAISFGEVWSAPDVPILVGTELNSASVPDAKLSKPK